MPEHRILSDDALARALAVPDLTDPAQGTHAMQLLVDDVITKLATAWDCAIETVRDHPVVAVEDNYDRLGFPPDAVTRDARYSRYVGETRLLRTHTSAMVPPALRRIARSPQPPRDLLLACPGLVYRRDVIDRLHTGTPHQLDLWRVTPAAMREEDLTAMIATVVAAALPGARWRTVPSPHPYTERGRQIDVADGQQWVEIGECGLAAPAVLHEAGLRGVTGLAMGLGLDRLVMLRKGIPDIRLLRSDDDRVARQMRDLSPYRVVSRHPGVTRDLSVAVEAGADPELLGDAVREALGDDARAVEAVEMVAETDAADLPPAAVDRLGLRPGQKNVLVRVVLRHPERTLTDAEANHLRDRVYAAIHRGTRHQWAGR